MKTPDEIKKGLACCTNDAFACSERCPYFNPSSNGVDCASELHTDVLVYIQQLEHDINVLQVDKADLKNKLYEEKYQHSKTYQGAMGIIAEREEFETKVPKWISVEERLPDKNGKYLVHAHHWVEGVKPIIRCILWLNGKWDKYDAYTADHWMPLPEPPEV